MHSPQSRTKEVFSLQLAGLEMSITGARKTKKKNREIKRHKNHIGCKIKQALPLAMAMVMAMVMAMLHNP